MNAIERLEELLDAKDEEVASLRNERDSLKRELDGSIDGWRIAEEMEDDGKLPLPRLELLYVKRRDWSSFDVIYRLVTKHLCGHLVATPLGRTRCDGGSNKEPSGPEDVPFRDGAHAFHDAAHLQLPLFKIMPDREPMRLTDTGASFTARGIEHRRGVSR
jgi:hypothetical protein